MILIIGLGNPGKKYENTPHNLGWRVLDLLQKKWGEEYGFSSWKKEKRSKTEISEGIIENEKVVMAKPLTFMNLSGQAVKSMISYYKISPRDLLIIHDDIDITLGKIKISKNRGTAGHKGIQSITENVKTKSFTRLRIGIKPEGAKQKAKGLVLKKLRKEEKDILEKTTGTVVKAVELIRKGETEKAMNMFNKK